MFVSRKLRFALWAALCFGSTAASSQPPMDSMVTSLQVSAWGSREAAERALTAAENHADPVFLFEVDSKNSASPYRVAIGSFLNTADAWAHQQRLDSTIFPESVIRRYPVRSKTTSAVSLPLISEYLVPNETVDAVSLGGRSGQRITQPVVKEELAGYLARRGMAASRDVDKTLLTKNVELMTKAEKLEVGINAPRNGVGVPALKAFLAENPQDPEANGARLRLARRLMGSEKYSEVEALLGDVYDGGAMEDKCCAVWLRGYLQMMQGDSEQAKSSFRAIKADENAPSAVRIDAKRRLAGLMNAEEKHDEALTLFREVVQQTDAAIELRMESLRRAGSLLHRSGNYPDAWLAMRQIYLSEPASATTAEAGKELVGFAMELVHRGIGTWTEVEELAAIVRQQPEIDDQTRATTALMEIESIYYEKDYARLTERYQELLPLFEPFKRERTSAEAFVGSALVLMEDYDRGRLLLRAVANEEIDPETDFFGATNQQAYALSWLAYAHMMERNKEAEIAVLFELRNRFPESREWQEAEVKHAVSARFADADEPQPTTTESDSADGGLKE